MIERLRPGDGPRLRAIRLRALAEAPEAFATTLAEAEERDPADWEVQIAALPTFIWREGDADLGPVRGAPRDGDPEAGYLISMWVAPEARGRGVGAVLVEGVVAWARWSGLRRLYLDVGLHNAAARRLYERMGFVATGAMAQTPACVREMEMVMALREGDLAAALQLGEGERPIDLMPHAMDPALDLTVLPDALAVCRLPAGADTPAWLDGEPFASVTRTPAETSVVCRAAVVPGGVRVETGWRALRVAGPLDFALTGVLASLLSPLATAGIAVFVLSTFDTDYVLVREAALDDAVGALTGAGHRIAPADVDAG